MAPMARRRRRGRVLRRLVRSGRRRLPLLIGLGVLGLLVVWCGWTVWSAVADLREVERTAQVLRNELEDGDAEGARQALADYQAAAESARDRTSGPTFAVLGHVPVVGDDVEAMAVAASVLDDLGQDGIPPVVESAAQVTAPAFRPSDHRFPLDRIAALAQPARESEQAFDDALGRLDEVDTDGLSGVTRTRFEELRSLVVLSRDTLDSAYRAAELMPELLGADGPRRYLLVFENNAELRSAGGLAGSVSLIEADRGRVDIVHQEPSHNFGITDRPPVPLTREEREVFGPALGQYFLNAVMTPDIPRAAELMAAHWEADRGQQIDGIFLVDPVAVSYLLAGIGPVDVPGYEPVDASTVVTAVEHTIYRLTTDFAEHDAYQDAVAKAVFNAFADGRGEAVGVIRGLVTGVAEGRIRMHSFDAAVQDGIAGTEIAGEMPGDDAEIGVYLNDAIGSKMSFFLQYDVSMVARSCTGAEAQELVGTVELTNDTPDDITDLPATVTGYVGPESSFEEGEQTIVGYLMLPGSGRLDRLEINGRVVSTPATFVLEDRLVVPFYASLLPDETETFEFALRTGPGQNGDVDVFVTPGPRTGTESQRVRSAC